MVGSWLLAVGCRSCGSCSVQAWQRCISARTSCCAPAERSTLLSFLIEMIEELRLAFCLRFPHFFVTRVAHNFSLALHLHKPFSGMPACRLAVILDAPQN